MFRNIYSIYRKFKALQIRGRHPHRMTDEDACNREETVCLNCGTHYRGDYCPNCGQEARTGRLRIRQGIQDLFGIFTNFDSGIMHTCIELIYRPGYMMYDYIKGHRREYVKPIQLLFLLTTIALVEHYILYGAGFDEQIDDGTLAEKLEVDEIAASRLIAVVKSVIEWIIVNKAIFCMLMVSMLVLPNRLVFKGTETGRGMNISEHFFVMMYVGCQTIMLQIIEMPMVRFIPGYDDSGIGFSFLLLIWDFNQLFRLSVRQTLIRSFLSSMFAFVILVLAIILFVSIILLMVAPEYVNDVIGS